MGSVGWWACAAMYGRVVIDDTLRHDKRNKATHRTVIADVNGRLTLTVPLSTPQSKGLQAPANSLTCEGPLSSASPLSSAGLLTSPSKLTWGQMLLSTHGEWWDKHRVALESAYGRTPFFEFYIDRFKPAMTRGVVERFGNIVALDRFIDDAVRSLLDLPPVELLSEMKDDIDPAAVVYMSKKWPAAECLDCNQAYYQTRASKLGFIGGLSIMDLLFNMGPEAQLYLHRLQQGM